MRIARFGCIILILCAAAGCGDGGGKSSTVNTGGTSGNTTPTPAPTANLSTAEAARFLTQATLGPSEADINSLRFSSYSAWLSAQTSAAVYFPTHQVWVEQRLAQLQAVTPTATLS